MKEYKHGNATIRVHGEYDLEKVKAATVAFLKKAEEQRKRCSKSNTERNRQGNNAS